ncbi:hypothetical protein ACFQBQ_03465 [Granulicella cerasi]|uniref:Uncharacterized protein n=1 Tax=Granulicella cerasi TaxID=741063 RepID=A0ABW1Z916_9BACT|nr:hypothetical protein [Granulicella cerasi]
MPLIVRLEKRWMRRFVRVLIGFLLAIAGLVLWAAVAMDYGDGVATGKYRFEHGKESSMLILKPDHTFEQTRRNGSVEEHAKGTWRHVGEGGISFSRDFLVVSGDEPESDGTTVSDMHKMLGLLPSLRLRQYHVLWYGKTNSDGQLAGTYMGDEPNVIATLVLKADGSFTQTIAQSTTTNHAIGTWKQDSDGTVRFSKDFLKTSGEPLQPDEIASSIDPRGSYLQIEISKEPASAQPVFHKRMLGVLLP